MTRMALLLIVAIVAGGCAANSGKTMTIPHHAGPEARSLLNGHALNAPTLTPERRAELEANLAKAVAAYEANPRDEQAIVWLGRRLAYLGRYRDAVDVYSRGLKIHPDSVALLRHRGHRYITLRRFNDAVRDLSRAVWLIESQEMADAIEPDGQPNAAGVPRSTLHDNVYYHLGLARYLRGEFEEASKVYRRAMSRLEMNDDMGVAFLYWLYNSESRDGRREMAAAVLDGIRDNMDVIENHAYYRLLLAFRRGGPPDATLDGIDRATLDYLTTAYGVANWHLANGDSTRASALMREAMTIEQWWPAFGFIAAEAHLARSSP